MKKRKYIIILAIVLLVCIGIGATYLTKTIIVPSINYNKGCEALDDGDYSTAIDIFNELPYDYKEVSEKRSIAHYYLGCEEMEDGDWQKAANHFGSSYYSDAREQYKLAYYNLGEKALKRSDYNEAVDCYKRAKDYKDSNDKLIQSYYELGCSLQKEEKYDKALEAFSNAGTYADAETKIATIRIDMLKNADKRDVVYFGSYEQDNDFTNGAEPIEWIVLNRVDNEFYLLSKYCLDCQPYNTEQRNVTWGSCTLRSWLNSTFYNTAFTDTEKRIITSQTHTNNDNSVFGTDGGYQSTEKVYIFTERGPEYYSDYEGIMAMPTEYLKANFGYGDGSIAYWLRTPGLRQEAAAFVWGGSGEVARDGTSVSRPLGVRPVITIDISLKDAE